MEKRIELKKRFNLPIRGRINIYDLLFYTAFSLFVITLCLQETIWYETHASGMAATIFSCIRYGSYILCFICILMRAHKNTALIFILALLAGIALSTLASTNKMMLMYSFILIAAYKMDGRKVIKTALFWQALILIGVILLSQVGILEDCVFDAETRARHGLGFSWATTAPIMYFYCLLMYIYLRRNKITTAEYILMLAIDGLLFLLTDARLAFVLSAAFIIIFCIAHWIKVRPGRYTKKIKNIFCALPACIAAFAIALHAFYNSSSTLWTSLNTLLTGRLELGWQAIKDYGFSLFGTPIEWVGYSSTVQSTEKYNFVDCSYLKLALEYGIVFLIITVVIYTVLIRKAIKAHDNYLLGVLIVVLVFGVTEPRLMHFAFNPFPVLLLASLRDEKNEAPYARLIRIRWPRAAKNAQAVHKEAL